MGKIVNFDCSVLSLVLLHISSFVGCINLNITTVFWQKQELFYKSPRINQKLIIRAVLISEFNRIMVSTPDSIAGLVMVPLTEWINPVVIVVAVVLYMVDLCRRSRCSVKSAGNASGRG